MKIYMVSLFHRATINKKSTDCRCQKQNVPQFTACGNNDTECAESRVSNVLSLNAWQISTTDHCNDSDDCIVFMS